MHGETYSMDLRERAIARLDAGESVRAVAAALSVAPSSVVKWSQRRRATGNVAPERMGGHVPRKIRGEHEAWLLARIADAPFTLRGLVAELAELAGRGLGAGWASTIARSGASCTARGSVSKKTPVASEQDRPDIARRRARWQRHQGGIDPRRLVFLDETWAKINMVPLRGWAPRGERLIGRAPYATATA